MASFAIKSAPRAADSVLLLFHEKTMWGGKNIRPGDEAFLFSAEHNGGSGLYARGTVSDAVRGEGIWVSVTVQRTAAAIRPVGRSELRRFRDRTDDRPEAELAHKLYVQATNKVAGISDAAAAFLRGFF